MDVWGSEGRGSGRVDECVRTSDRREERVRTRAEDEYGREGEDGYETKGEDRKDERQDIDRRE